MSSSIKVIKNSFMIPENFMPQILYKIFAIFYILIKQKQINTTMMKNNNENNNKNALAFVLLCCMMHICFLRFYYSNRLYAFVALKLNLRSSVLIKKVSNIFVFHLVNWI